MIALLQAPAPIDLDELTARASLLVRTDRKYVVPAARLPAVLAALPGDVRVLEIAGSRSFAYRSTYFDTPELDSYRAAAYRRRRRFKIRIRTYVDSDQHFLEVKTAGQRGATVKQRVPYDGDRRQLGTAGRAYADTVLAGAGFRTGGLRFAPVLTTGYRRTTLFLPSDGSRLTVDADCVWTLPDGTVGRMPGRVVVETKSPRAACDADRLLWSSGHRPCAISKYATGLAALRPELPAHRWRPVLRRHFTDSAPTAHLHTEES